MRVVVNGNRWWSDAKAIREELIELPRPLTVVHGAQRGADSIADVVATAEEGMTPDPHRADWSHGPSGGPKRNEEVARTSPDLWLAFWDGETKNPNGGNSGTLDGIVRAVKHRVPVVIHPDGYPGSVLGLIKSHASRELAELRLALWRALGLPVDSKPSDSHIISELNWLVGRARDV